ncbi:hypothetical protein SO802_011030 [Lithocarpus litseifolius]|uniref:Major facilitator superfamily (MFS) profile domain-containing protein n=1 Tax=Lithocarpus litseifolius TaxID=425828 RepID=A0AAW2DFW0_9ROSI
MVAFFKSTTVFKSAAVAFLKSATVFKSSRVAFFKLATATVAFFKSETATVAFFKSVTATVAFLKSATVFKWRRSSNRRWSSIGDGCSGLWVAVVGVPIIGWLSCGGLWVVVVAMVVASWLDCGGIWVVVVFVAVSCGGWNRQRNASGINIPLASHHDHVHVQVSLPKKMLMQTFITVFTDANPTWHCTSDQLDCNSVSNICNLPNNSWAWDLPAYTSIISACNLECSVSIITGLPAASFFVGCLVGGIVLATLADSSLGRKNMLFLSCLTMSLSSLFTVFSTNIWVYSALKLVCGFCRATIGTSALVLTAELVGKRWRGQVGVPGFFCFTIGFLSLPAIAYLNRVSP